MPHRHSHHAPIVVTALALYWAASATTLAASGSPVGVNLEQFRSYSPEWSVVDVFTKTRRWIPGGRKGANGNEVWNVCQKDNRIYDRNRCESEPPLTLDDGGWVVDHPRDIVPHTQVFEELEGDFPAGRYLIFYEGSGSVRVSGSVDHGGIGACRKRQFRNNRGCFRITEPDDGGINVWIEKSDPENPVRNIRIIVPGGVPGVVSESGEIISLDPTTLCEPAKKRTDRPSTLSPGKQCIDLEHAHWNRFQDPVDAINSTRVLFHPQSIQYLDNFSVLRFMQWQRINGSKVKDWDERTPLGASNWNNVPSGVPPEILLKLAEAAGATPWINIPHLADETWSRRFAELAAALLPEDGELIVEWSNEVWNAVFSQTRWARKEASERDYASDNDTKRVNRLVADESIRHARIWRDVLGKRVRFVIAGQASNPEGLRERLGWNDAWQSVDAVAVAPYFGHSLGGEKTAGDVVAGGLDALFARLESPGLFGTVIEGIKTARGIAREYDLPLISYEGGQHLAAWGNAVNNRELTALFIKANADPRMGELYTRYLDAWRGAGGELMVHHTQLGRWTKWGSWGLKRRQSQTRADSPKLDATLGFIERNRCWWAGCESSTVALTAHTANSKSTERSWRLLWPFSIFVRNDDRPSD